MKKTLLLLLVLLATAGMTFAQDIWSCGTHDNGSRTGVGIYQNGERVKTLQHSSYDFTPYDITRWNGHTYMAYRNTTLEKAFVYDYEGNSSIDFGANTTGGNNQNKVVVSTAEQLKDAVSGTNPATIYVKGQITLNKMLSVGSNKSIIGLAGASISNTNRNEDAGIFLLKGSENVIIRNLTLLGPGAYDIDANYSDNISLVGAKNIWVDHCDIQDGIDGNFDIVEGSDNICVSWTHFSYLIEPKEGGSGGSSDHRNCNLIGNSDKTADIDEGHLNCTFICCWWGEGCSERCPRVRFGKVHVVNCLYDGNNYNYCIGYGVYSNIFVEKCAFVTDQAKENAIKDWSKEKDYNLKIVGCLGVDDVELARGERGQFVPTYEYHTFDANLVPSVLRNKENGAGATLKIEP